MRYVSTRGEAPDLDFEGVLLTGLARDGGLYLPEAWPQFSPDDLAGLAGRPYAEVAAQIIRPFVGDCLDDDVLAGIVADTYAGFEHAAVAPLKQLDERRWLLELFHGPTLAFKDYALQLLGRLFDHVLAKRGERVTIIGATSGDTGSAAIEACRGRDAIDIFMLHPEGRVSEVQRRQMTTLLDDNVHNIAIQGTFDDCQALVKACFNDLAFRDQFTLSAVNSINWVRVMAQIVYYVTSGIAVGAPGRSVAFSVPTGNFGNVYAGYAAARMGLPVERLIVATNRNDILARFFGTGDYRKSEVMPTTSPSMDIQVASNFERLLFDLHGRDGVPVRGLMAELGDQGGFTLAPNAMARAAEDFVGHRVDEDKVLATVRDVRAATGEVVDPHSAVGIAAADAVGLDPSVPVISLATAHPAKFPDAVAEACGVSPALPPRLADLLDRPERFQTLPNDLATVQDHVRRSLGQ